MTETDGPQFVIIGGGIAGLVLALALKKHVGIKSTVYEQAQGFVDGVGGAIGMYPNGLRVIRDISPELLAEIRKHGYPYLYRRWMRHDGSEVACAKESVLCEGEEELQSIGIRRYRLQRVLYDFALKEGIDVQFGKRLERIENVEPSGYACSFTDGSNCEAAVIFGADGLKSMVRECTFGKQNPEYTGVTCLMGAANVARPFRGICFPSSSTSKCHACYYPTGDDEQVFQLFFPSPEKPETWGALSAEDAKQECQDLADKLESEGWHQDFVKPVRESATTIRVGLRAREPLQKWVKDCIFLLGDAAHPPVPYIGQGAMMACEDAGVLAMLIKEYCLKDGLVSLASVDKVGEAYEILRIPRTTDILGKSHVLGSTQQNRSESKLYNIKREWSIKFKVMLHGTLPIMFPGAKYNYTVGVEQITKQIF